MSPDSSFIPPATISATQNPSKALLSSSETTSLKVVIVGSEGVGKTSFVRRFVSEELGIPIDKVTPTASSSVCTQSPPSPVQPHRRRRHERPPGTISTGVQQKSEVGLDIYELELPSTDEISTNDDCSGDGSSGNIHRLTIWDFSGKAESLQAVQKVFFTPKTLYVVLWDMAAKDVTPLEYECATATANTPSGYFSSSINNHSHESIKCSKHDINSSTQNDGSRSQSHRSTSSSTFDLGYDSDSDSSDYNYVNDCDVDMYNQEELRGVKRKLEKDIDKKVQCWIDRIQAIAPGATILPMATHKDRLRPKNRSDLTDSAFSFITDEFQQKEIKKRCWLLKERIASNESRKVKGVPKNKSKSNNCNEENSFSDCISTPNLLFGSVQKDGQAIPHAVTTSCVYGEDNEMEDLDIDDMLLELQTNSGHECKEIFSSARKFILSTALTIATEIKRQERDEPGCHGKGATFPENSVVIGEKQSMPASLATVMLRDVRQKLWHRSKIVQTNYFTDKFETREQNREATKNAQRGDGDGSCNDVNNSAVLSALNSLHLSGELCYFGGMVPSSGFQHQEQFPEIQLSSDFVVLDPTWLIDSIDFILQYGKKSVQKTSNGRTTADLAEPSDWHRSTNCPTIEKEEVLRLWKNRYSTKQGLGLAEHYHQFQHREVDKKPSSGVADQVFEFIHNLLIRHGVFIPLSYQKSGSRHFFLPCLLHQKKAYCDTINKDSPRSTQLVPTQSILQDLAHSKNSMPENERYTDPRIDLDSANLKGACHGFVIVDRAPETLIQRIIVQTIKSLRGILSTNHYSKIEVEEFYFWKDSFRLKLRVHTGDKREEQSVEINSVLLEAPGCGTNSRIVTCDSMLVTSFQGCDDSESQEIWRETCLKLRDAIQNALDEIPGIQYREEGICPHCLNRKHISDTGTWTLSKLKSAFNNKEAFVRCRHGHRTETKLNGLLHCQLVDYPGASSTKNDSAQQIHSSRIDRRYPTCEPHPSSATNSISLKNQALCVPSSHEGKPQDSPSAVKIGKPDQICSRAKRRLIKDATKKKMSFFNKIANHRDIVFSSTIDYMAKTEPRTQVPEILIERELSEAENQEKQNNQVYNSKVMLLLDRCKTKMERLFHKKHHLGLDNRKIPVEI